ncbi:MAG: hypothetical protein WDZ31_05745 [Phycisphaeraceae bacterium]
MMTRRDTRSRGAAAVLAMMFLVIFGSLAAAMAIVSQGNLATADSHMKVNRSLAAAETGMRFMTYRITDVADAIHTREGEITAAVAEDLWQEIALTLMESMQDEFHNVDEPSIENGVLHIGPISLGPDAPTFTATVQPHPIAGEDYSASYYDRPPFSTMSPAISNDNALDARWLRVRVVAGDGPEHSRIHRSIQQDFRVDKKIPYAILARSRVMIGRNVMIEGPLGSRFTETHLDHGHPVHVLSDFKGLTDDFDELLEGFYGDLDANDLNGDNRLSLANAAEMDGITDPSDWDVTDDGYISEWDLFLRHFGQEHVDGQWRVSENDLASAGVNDVIASELLNLVDTFGDDGRPGYGDGYLDADDRYAKIQGQVYLDANLEDWEDGAAAGNYRDYLQGPIRPDHNHAALTFDAQNNDAYQFDSSDFDVSTFREMVDYAGSDLASQAVDQASGHDPDDPDSPQPLGTYVTEPVAYGSAHPYDFFDRPVYENMTFRNVKIPKGTNALFRNCRFIGVTFVESNVNNTDPNYNYAGMQESDGTLKHPGVSADVDNQAVEDTKTQGNNLRFDNCTFEGAVVTDAPKEFTHTRNKIAFNGKTAFVIEGSSQLSESEKALFRRSTILAPHYSVEMGTFVSPDDPDERVELSGAIVGGVVDLRGNIDINGMIVTTFEPKSDTGPVLGETSPQFNTTLGYFGTEDGDLEGELPATGLGTVQIRYDPTLALPDGILGPIQIKPVVATYFEGGQ